MPKKRSITNVPGVLYTPLKLVNMNIKKLKNEKKLRGGGGGSGTSGAIFQGLIFWGKFSRDAFFRTPLANTVLAMFI